MKRYVLCLMLLLGMGTLRAQEPADSLPQRDEAVGGPARTTGDVPADELWDRANTAYINGDYRGAAEIYGEILDRGLGSVKLYYNLANACFKEGQTGRAILFYRRALRLAPGNDDIRYNLSVAEARTKDTIERIPEFFLVGWVRAVRHAMSCTAWSVLSLVVLACGLALALLYLLAKRLSLRKTGFYGTLAAVLLFVVTTSFAAGERREMLDDTQAVIKVLHTRGTQAPPPGEAPLHAVISPRSSGSRATPSCRRQSSPRTSRPAGR